MSGDREQAHREVWAGITQNRGAIRAGVGRPGVEGKHPYPSLIDAQAMMSLGRGLRSARVSKHRKARQQRQEKRRKRGR